ncbi:MAG: class I SAM-dependent methyltransferase [Bacteroidota bacterium]
MNTDLADLSFYKRWLPKDKAVPILELCCGTGRLTIPIAADGYSITGVDYTTSMLEAAKAKATALGLQVKFIEADVRVMNLSQQYDFIFIPFNSIHHLYRNEDLIQALQVVKNHLIPGGLFLLDCFNPNLEYIIEGTKQPKEIAQYTTVDGREVQIRQTMNYCSSSQMNRIEWHYSINGQFDSVQNLDMRLFFPRELDAYLKWSGFEVLHKFGDFAEGAFDDHSDKQIFVCQPINL